MKTYTLAELALLFNNEKLLRQELGPSHELRPDGIFVAPEWQSESYRDEHLPGVQLNLPKTRILDAVLPAEFTEGQLMAFLAIRTDLAFELERHYTNDGPDGAAETSAMPLNEERLASLEGSLPAFAEILRRRLPRGTQWYLDTEADHTGRVTSDGQEQGSAKPAPTKSGWMEEARKVAVTLIERYAARDLYPPLGRIADEVAKDLRSRQVFGASGAPLSGGTIKRHALRGLDTAAKRKLGALRAGQTGQTGQA